MVETGLADEIKVTEKSGGSEVITDKFGIIRSATHTHREPVRQKYSVGQGPKPQANIDGVTETEGGLTCEPHKLAVLEVFGTYTDNGDGTYTVTPDNTLPTYTFKQQKVSGGGVVTLDTFKFGSFSLSASEGGEMQLEMSGMAEDFQEDGSETISTESVGGTSRVFFDTKVKMDGTVIGSLDTWQVDFNRDLEAFKGIEDDASGNKRKPSQIIEKLFDGSYRLVINIENSRAYEEVLGDSTNPKTIQDSRSDVTTEIVVDTSAGTDTFKLTGSRPDEVTSDMENDAEKRTATVRGVYTDWQVDGDI